MKLDLEALAVRRANEQCSELVISGTKRERVDRTAIVGPKKPVPVAEPKRLTCPGCGETAPVTQKVRSYCHTCWWRVQHGFPLDEPIMRRGNYPHKKESP